MSARTALYIDVVSIVALSLAAVAESSAKSERVSHLVDQVICRNALGQSGWDQNPNFSEYVGEATRRGFTVESCRQLIGLPRMSTPGYDPSASTQSGNNSPASTGNTGSKAQSYDSFRSLSDYRDKDGLVTLALKGGGGRVIVFRDGDSMTKAITLMHANINDPLLMLPLVSCLVESGSRASVEGPGRGYVPSVAIWVVEGDRAGCRGVVPMAMLRVQKN